jgi:hypothetical protein
MRLLDDPAHLTPEDRRREVARILARALLRIRDRRISQPASDPGNCEETDQNSLEVGPNPRLSVHTG